MGPKKDNNSSKMKKNYQNHDWGEEKIIAKQENSVGVSGLATQYGMAKSMICAILKNRDKQDIKQNSQTIKEEEIFLLIWINEKMLAGDCF